MPFARETTRTVSVEDRANSATNKPFGISWADDCLCILLCESGEHHFQKKSISRQPNMSSSQPGPAREMGFTTEAVRRTFQYVPHHHDTNSIRMRHYTERRGRDHDGALDLLLLCFRRINTHTRTSYTLVESISRKYI